MKQLTKMMRLDRSMAAVLGHQAGRQLRLVAQWLARSRRRAGVKRVIYLEGIYLL
jgi:hypothetical protein